LFVVVIQRTLTGNAADFLYAESLIYIFLTFIVVKETLYISQWFTVDVDSTLGTLCCVDVGSVVDILDVHATFIFRVEVNRVDVFVYA
jgi:drug/metabolite transporter (DMT)-like permease